jgi:PAS domain S-box-containing protein
MKLRPPPDSSTVECPLSYRTAFLSSLDTNAALLDRQGSIVAVNDAWKHFGCENGALLPSITVGVNYVEVCRRAAEFCPDAVPVLDGLLSVLTGASPIFRLEYRCDAPEISRWFLLTVTPWHSPEGGVLVSHMDISEYKLSAELQRRTLDSIRAIVWTADAPTFRTTFLSGQVERILGFPMDAWLNDKDLWKRHIHPDDRDWVLSYSSKAVGEGRDYELDYRMLAADGHTVWLHQVVNIVRQPRRPTYLVGISIDVTELHRTREELRILSGRLLVAQDQERARIARELHDSISQSLALLKMRLNTLQGKTRTLDDLRIQLQETEDMCDVVCDEVRTLSHRLHSSRLDSLGLAKAVRSLCEEMGTQQSVQVEVTIKDIPARLPSELSLCLFRVLQEALLNAVKHSGVRLFQVGLHSTSSEINLSIHDSGVGFDVTEAMRGSGLGLVSMRERLHLLGGRLSIQSGLGHGTTIEACVPLSRA